MKWSQPADRKVVEAVVRTFRVPDADLRPILAQLSLRQWQRSYYWLDASGMALYLLRRLETLDLLDTLPTPVHTRLEQNRTDNRERTTAMFREFAELNRAFQQAAIAYGNLKGFSLSPDSCPDPALRVQLDFDFLVDGAHLARCREVLASRGYILRGATDTVLEFKTQSDRLASIDGFYKPCKQLSVEVHFTCAPQSPHQPTRDERLDRLQWRQVDGVRFPTLSPVDQFIGQATHIMAHLCSSATRLAWLIELSHHLTLRFDDRQFWTDVTQRVESDRHAEIAIASVCLLLQQFFGTAIPPLLQAGPLQRLPAPIRLWMEHYAVRAILADFPGTKLSLLLREQLPSGDRPWSAERRKALIPASRPPRIHPVSRDAGPWKRLMGELYQLRFVLFRLRFHLVEGLRYLWEVRRWRELLERQQLPGQAEAVTHTEAVSSR